MKKRVLIVLLSMSIALNGCGFFTTGEPAPINPGDNATLDKTVDDSKEKDDQTGSQQTAAVSTSLLGDEEVIYYDKDLVPSVAPYSVNSDFSNVVYDDEFAWMFDPNNSYDAERTTELRNALIENNFAVAPNDTYSEFFDVYESNRYMQFPSFVSVDSLMHTYHIYFAFLMKKTEKNYLAGELKNLSADMLSSALKQYEALKGTEWEAAALRNVEFFYIGSLLMDDSVSAPVNDGEFEKIGKEEYGKIMNAGGIELCAVSGLNEDYTQYKPRGYYAGDEQLEKYFRAMMWYGRTPYALDKEETIKSAILQTIAIDGARDKWEGIYNITAFFAGASDDPGFAQLSEIVSKDYGKMPSESDLTGNADALKSVLSDVKTLAMPSVNSIPVEEGDDPVIPSYRFIGQRFTVDAAIMQRLVYSSVEENDSGDRRYLPDTLDTAAALGSETALSILDEQGDTKYKNYTDNLKVMQDHFNNNDPKIWNASLYAGWLNTLRPLFEEKGEGYPSYMQSKEWTKKNLETFAGSYAELKHDTILYAKQVAAEMGGDDSEIIDDRGYVDPQPVIYSRFAFLSNKTAEGLEAYGMLDDTAKEDLNRLSEIALTLLSISEKELKNESLSDEDYEFIRSYGGSLEHFWLEANKEYGDDLCGSYQAPCPVVADIATDPNGSVLEVGSGFACTMYVVFPIDGELHIGRGSAYDFYQFTVPMSERMTDEEWKKALAGGYLDDDWNWVETDNKPDKPEWTKSYRKG